MSVLGLVVVHFAGRHYVMRETDDATIDRTVAIAHIASEDAKWMRTRQRAVLLAHDMNNALNTPRGVRELFLDDARRKRHREASMDDEDEI